MEPNKKKENCIREYKLFCFISVFWGLYTGIDPFLPTAEIPIIVNGVLNTNEFSIIIVIAMLSLSVLTLVSGILGYLKKINATIVVSALASAIGLYLLITKILAMAATEEWKAIVGNVLSMSASVAIPIILIVSAIPMKKYLQSK